MHEVTVARDIVSLCTRRAAGHRVLRVTLEIGALTCILPEALRFCYGVAVRGTPLEASELDIRRIPGHSRCRDCGRDVELHDLLAACVCGSNRLLTPQGGDQLKVKSIDIEETE